MERTHLAKIKSEYLYKLLDGTKSCEYRVGDKYLRVKPGDLLLLTNEDHQGRPWCFNVRAVEQYRDLATYQSVTGREEEELEAVMRDLYGWRVDREPFVVIHLNVKPIEGEVEK